ncbi:hypothetical protein SERLADRAFT_454995 [Serpula lacrymans var. lacrymans S7.9]|uniref:Uncharacterized protein n=1 Tax=Serpula lacrymans var. lacrymans (strain S7.9) TaxID=578457 RepID=F8NCX4_SERL9|nr:uncharacterized protein SERLADRAFT_454995 [Serpula lacrymans var. lacrymans S7.9]EGO30718.1 hypothetical protein SERLADRAFT_454995 [Serpula lacrymans var. lacrymans S7.9]
MDMLYPVKLRMQGVLSNFNLASLGTWNGIPLQASSACQTLTLTSGPFHDQWQPILSAICNICQLIHVSLGENSYEEPPILSMHNLYM